MPQVTTVVMEAADVDVPGHHLRVEDHTRDPGELSRAAISGAIELLGGPCTEGCDGTVALTAIRYEEEVGSVLAEDEWGAQRLARVVTEWRLYDANGELIEALPDVGTLDRWTADGPSDAGALAGLVPRGSVAAELALSTGIAYAHRLRSGSWTFTRSYFGGGPLRLGAIALRDGDAKGAIAQWSRVARDAESPRLAARAHHDLAVGYEMIGAAYLARAHVDLASSLAASPRTRRYADLLEETRGGSRPLRQFDGDGTSSD